MERTIRLSLNKFSSVPASLRLNPVIDVSKDEIVVNLGHLYHHYYWDCYCMDPPDPDPAQFEYLRFLANTKPFLLRGKGLGAHTGARRNRSMELGQAFCRWFLHEHLGVVYFAHVSEIIERQLSNPFANCSLKRVGEGDAPDYLCAPSVHTAYLAEAKGRYESISFANRDFASWRNQFNRVVFRNARDEAEALKGFVVATRFATEDGPNIKSTLYAEDPQSPGERSLNEGGMHEIATAVVATHYGRIAERLGQTILAASLRVGFTVPVEIQFNAIAWELQMGPLQGTRFIGGYHPPRDGGPVLESSGGKIHFTRSDPFRLGVGNGTFVGVKESIFGQMASSARGQVLDRRTFDALPPTPAFYSAISLLRDGSIVGPVEFFRPVERVSY